MTNKNLKLVYDTLLCIPGMNDAVRIDLRPSRKLLLLLQQAVEKGLRERDGEGLIDSVSEQEISELRSLVEACLEKSGLIELAEKLKAVQQFK